MISRMKSFWNQPLSRKNQRLGFIWIGLVTRCWYKLRLRSLGRGTLIGKPLFWTPEYLEVGDNVLIWPGCRLEGINHASLSEEAPPRIVLGNNVSFQQYCHITSAQQVEIGARTSVLFGVMITDTDHCYDQVGISPAMQPLITKPTIIDEDCFIGAGAIIQAGTRLGRHCIVGANAVVRGSFPDYCVIVGAPARIVKRYDLERCQWRLTDSLGSFFQNSD